MKVLVTTLYRHVELRHIAPALGTISRHEILTFVDKRERYYFSVGTNPQRVYI